VYWMEGREPEEVTPPDSQGPDLASAN